MYVQVAANYVYDKQNHINNILEWFFWKFEDKAFDWKNADALTYIFIDAGRFWFVITSYIYHVNE